MGKFTISTRSNGEYQFNLKAGNGQVILSSEGYSAKASCLNGIESVRKNSQDDDRYEHLTAANGKLYFNLKSTNGQVIGSSQMYADETGRTAGVDSVKNNAPEAEVEDLS
ncbi:MAG: YegP family protein [Saprospiraceae bacterium]|nr:YegP family protein [Saprospiraceae bacterium]MBK9721017.1 YegP family protein [Saprospiraceae bacterium]MBK9728007.1 YegP family protein [Saprospiraceae bacterium]